MSAIEVKQLTKDYGSFRALDGINLSVPRGEVFGFIGPNGAGKSTTIRILLGLLRKTSGEIALLGGDPWEDAVEIHKKLAYVPSDVNLWPNLTGGEVIDLLGRLRGGFDKNRRIELLKRFDFDPSKKCRTYSKGNRQKVVLISAFLSNADLLILDEPTGGLDPLMEAVFQECVKEAKRAGKTIVLSSHILAEVEALCDRISIIKKGKIVESGTLTELRHLTHTVITVETVKPLDGIEKVKGVYDISRDGVRVKLNVDAAELDNVLKYLTTFGVRSLNSAPPTLEELFMRHYEHKTV